MTCSMLRTKLLFGLYLRDKYGEVEWLNKLIMEYLDLLKRKQEN